MKILSSQLKKTLVIFWILFEICSAANSQSINNSFWIWYPGEFEVWLHTVVAGRRQERGQPYPPFWRVDSPYGLIKFEKTFHLSKPERIKIFAEGRFRLRINGKVIYNFNPMSIELPKGKNHLEVLVENYETFPSVLVEGTNVFSDDSWMVTNQDKNYFNATKGEFSDPKNPPNNFQLEYTPLYPDIIESSSNKLLVDFGKETFGKIVIHNLKGQGVLEVYYGESMQEALSKTQAETFDYLKIDKTIAENDTTDTRAFRYVYTVWDSDVSFEFLSAQYEYLPLDYKGNFSSSDSLINRIYDVSLYTLHLNTREFHLDGIKRDRWVWSGDAYQSYLMNFYTFFDEDVNKRTIYALRGHDPVTTHINTILDYSFYWIIGIHDHFLYTGDTAFIKEVFPRMKTLMEFCLSRTNETGFIEGQPEDWVFIDWAPISKKGEISFIQMLLAASLKSMAQSAKIVSDSASYKQYYQMTKDVEQNIFKVFWNEEKNFFVHNREGGILSEDVTRYANMFAILFNLVDYEQKQKIKESVILNNEILKITTPYMKFYELASLCEIGEQEKAIDFVKNYWGGMLNLGATSFWEVYDPTLSDDEHYRMYGRPFGKSLCHAWGANPVYLFGKYLLGVKPTSPGYKSFIIEPSLGGLDWIKGSVPTPNGNIEVYMDKKKLTVKPVMGLGVLRIKSQKIPKSEKGVSIRLIKKGLYEIELTNTIKEYTIRYWE